MVGPLLAREADQVALQRLAQRAPDEQRVGDIMTRSPKIIAPDMLVSAALAMMNQAERPFTALFVVEDAIPVGIIHIHHLLRIGVA